VDLVDKLLLLLLPLLQGAKTLVLANGGHLGEAIEMMALICGNPHSPVNHQHQNLNPAFGRLLQI